MKDKALYHLLQLRARNLQEQLPQEAKADLSEIQKSLTIRRDPGEYVLQWQWSGNAYLLKIGGDEFAFYEKGDSAKSVAKRGGQLNHRQQNWQAALNLWRQIFSECGLRTDVLVDNGVLAFGEFDRAQKSTHRSANIGFAGLLGVLALTFQPTMFAISIAIFIFLLLELTDAFTLVHLRQEVTLFEKALVAAGGVLAMLLSVDMVVALGIVLGLYCLSHAERLSHTQTRFALAAGMAFGIGAYASSALVIGVVVSMSVLFAITSLVDSVRFKKLSVLLILVGFGVGIYLGKFADPVTLVTTAPSLITPGEGSLANLVLLLSMVTFLGFALWWIVGTQYYLVPWLSLLALSIAGAVVVLRQLYPEQATYLVYSGFIIFVAQRLVRGVLVTNK